MKCDFCSEPATVHITDMSQGKYRVLHLCGGCAEKEKNGELKQHLNVEHIVKKIIAAFAGELAGELAKLSCPYCGTKYMEFRAKGRLGCPADYEVFQKGLVPLLERIHGSAEHVGKCPRRRAATASPHAELIRLRRELRSAVESEDYEKAARLRDVIRAKETSHGS
jgi:protein arginine kinase activator